MALQKSVGINPAQAVEGDFASTNPRATAVNNNGGFISDGTVVVGGFAWAKGNILSVNMVTGQAPTGFISRTANFAYINSFESSTLIINKGVETTVHVSGDFYVLATVSATKGQKVFASRAGTVIFGASGDEIANAIETNFFVTSDANAGELVIISTY